MNTIIIGALDAYIIDVLMPDIVGHDRAPTAFLVFLYLWRRSGGDGRRAIEASYQNLANETGISRSSAQAAIRLLLRRELISRERDGATDVPRYRVHRPWRR